METQVLGKDQYTDRNRGAALRDRLAAGLGALNPAT